MTKADKAAKVAVEAWAAWEDVAWKARAAWEVAQELEAEAKRKEAEWNKAKALARTARRAAWMMEAKTVWAMTKATWAANAAKDARENNQ